MVRAAEPATQAQPSTPEPEPVTALRGAPVNDLLRLQRTAGNRAVLRLLSRQTTEEEVPTGPPVRIGDPVPLPERSRRARASPQTPTPLPGATPPACEYRVSGPRVAGQQDPAISSIVGPGLLPNGGFLWRVAYALPAAATADGWIIQQRHMNASGSTGTGDCIWETWKVLSGQSTPEQRSPGGYDDTYISASVRLEPGRSWFQILGVAAFYPGPLPPEFGPENPGQTAYKSSARPASWNGHGRRHDCFSVTVNPPPAGQPLHRLVADDGIQEVTITA